jgi:hypothetical protein
MPKRKLIKPILLVQLFNVLPRYIVAASAIPAADTGSWCSEVLVCESVLFFLLASALLALYNGLRRRAQALEDAGGHPCGKQPCVYHV